MAVNLQPPDPATLNAVAGVELGISRAGIRKPNRRDLLVMRLAQGSRLAAVFTRNRFCAAPVQLGQKHLASSASKGMRAIVVNTGCANAGTGQTGLDNAKRVCAEVAQRLGCDTAQVMPMSTGVILEHLPVDRIVAGLDAAIADLAPAHWAEAAEAIMTTDTIAKAASEKVEVQGRAVHVSGISKGAGMIRPNMGTMLGVIATDACVAQPLLERWLREITDRSFNRITVDGDTSTNDTLMLVASGAAGNAEIASDDAPGARELRAAVQKVALSLAQAIVRDGEGATKFITIHVEQGRTAAEVSAVAYAIAHSPLVKTAFFASDPNLGRILAAVGYAGIPDLDQTKIDLYLDDVHVATAGGRHPSYQEADGQRVMKKAEIEVRVKLARGEESTTVWTCDLSHDYVSINADYRS